MQVRQLARYMRIILEHQNQVANGLASLSIVQKALFLCAVCQRQIPVYEKLSVGLTWDNHAELKVLMNDYWDWAAQTIHLMADTVALISGKNSLYENHTHDDSGILLREIETQGQIQQDAVAATLTAEQITLNGRELADATLSTAALLQQVSSEGQLTDAQLATLQAQLQNQSWHEQQTTLSKMGSLIVQAVATYLAPGVGSSFGQSLG